MAIAQVEERQLGRRARYDRSLHPAEHPELRVGAGRAARPLTPTGATRAVAPALKEPEMRSQR